MCSQTWYADGSWSPHLDALANEPARGRRERRLRGTDDTQRSTS